MTSPTESIRTGRVPRSTGFTIVEAVLSMVVVGIMLTAALSTVGLSGKLQRHLADRARAEALADDLVAEIRAREYEDPDASLFGLELSEAGFAHGQFDDVDDYDALVDAPPKDAAGAAIAGASDLTRKARVHRVMVATPGTSTSSETGLKRITVTVLRGDQLLATRVFLKGAIPEDSQ